ncbi:cytochrome b [Pseudoxanthomonas putridarboris]|uniref:Cytochrome b n=2 Tax=Pseudoxanthomonas putridarboris TaxID=752605 RepID=A0ABU9IWJ7_9GAMM
MQRRPPTHWAWQVRLLHWLGVLLILAVAGIGLVMVDLERGTDLRKTLYALHKSLGITVLGMAALRVLVRLSTRAPAPLDGPAWQLRLARASHASLYVLMIAVPLSGWLLNSVAGQPLPWFGMVDLPALAAKNADLRKPADTAHVVLFWTLAGLVCVHAAAALHHHWMRGDATLRRMLPPPARRAG